MPKEYLQAPNFDLPPPPSGPLKLGHILDEPDEPRYPLNEYDIAPPLKSETYTQTATGFSATRSQLGEKSFKLWAKLTDLVPIGIGASASRKNDSTDVFSIKTMETIFFLPSKSYVERSVLQSADVKTFLQGSRWGAKVFMITGLKVARGASVTTHKLKEKGDSADGSVNLGALGVPVDFGASAGRADVSEEVTSIANLGDFILGYQLRKIVYKKGKPIKHQAHNVGAVFDSDPVAGGGGGKEEAVDIEGLEEADVMPDALEWEGLSPSQLASDERIWIRSE